MLPLFALVLLSPLAVGPIPATPAELSYDDRVAAQRAIERVYFRHRIWPAANPGPKPSFETVIPEPLLRRRVESYLAKSTELERHGRPISAAQLQAEMDRMARESRAPGVLRELFAALGNDAGLIAETLARPALADRLLRSTERTAPIDSGVDTLSIPVGDYALPELTGTGCVEDTWRTTGSNAPKPRTSHVGVWTGAELIVWGGTVLGGERNTGGRYDPATDTWVATSTAAQVATSRDSATAVWTGSEMIVWGGYGVNSPNYLNSGSRYDPASDTWRSTSTFGSVPSARRGHRAVWTGTAMLVWGGEVAGAQLTNTGGRYDPTSNTWSTLSVVNAPTVRHGHTAVWTGSQMIVWGGRTPQATYLASGGRYDPSTDTWTPTATGSGLPVARGSHGAVWTGSQMIVWGGTNGSSLNSGGRYDPVSDTWSPTSMGTGVPTARYGPSAIWTGTEMIVWGGDGAPSLTNTGGRYDPESDTWAPTAISPPTPSARRAHVAVWTGTEMIVWGGSALGDPTNTGGRYDPGTDQWTSTSTRSDIPEDRYGQTVVWTGAEMIVWGGQASGSTLLNTGGRYDPATDAWTATSVLPEVSTFRDNHSAVWTGTEMIVWGGSDSFGYLNTGGRYDPITDTWTPTGTGLNVPTQRRNHTAVWTGSEMIVWGGNDVAAVAVQSGGRYDPASDTWAPTSTGVDVPSPRRRHSAIWTGDRMIVWGGDANFQEFLNTGAVYDPAANSWTATGAGPGLPAARAFHAVVWTGTEMIVWGGMTGFDQRTNTGGRYDPLAGTWLPTSVGVDVPREREGPTGIWTGSEMIVWGGRFGSAPFDADSGGRYSPATDTWTPTSMGPHTPVGREGHTATWTGTEMIVWGGQESSGRPIHSGGGYCACPSGRLAYRDLDGDGFGDSATVVASCDGLVPPGYVAQPGDCVDTSAGIHPGAPEACNGVDEDCDAVTDEDDVGLDSDRDAIRNACDNCRFQENAAQSDGDGDGDGDACDLDDGAIWTWREDADTLRWQPESGVETWNVYFGDLNVLKGTGVYTQEPGSNPLADRRCALASTAVTEETLPAAAACAFSLVAPVSGGVEGSLGSGSQGPRPNEHPCP